MKSKQIAVFAVVAAVIVLSSLLVLVNYTSKPISDAELQKRTMQLSEVKAFLSKYPDANVQFNQDSDKRTIDYAASLDSNPPYRYRYLLTLNISVDKTTGDPKQIVFTCAKGNGTTSDSYSVSTQIEQEIKNENCLRF